jgi:hypothetical protein
VGSEEGQESQSSKQMIGLLKCANSMLHKQPAEGYVIPDMISKEERPSEVLEIFIADMLETGKMVMEEEREAAKVDNPVLEEQQSEERLNVMVGDGISDAQRISETSFNSQLQAQKEEKINKKSMTSSRKRSLEGTKLSNQNSFVVLDVEYIASLAGDMGVLILPLRF